MMATLAFNELRKEGRQMMPNTKQLLHKLQKQPLKKVVVKNFAVFARKHLSWSLFLLKLPVFRPATLLGRYSTQVFCCCEIFKTIYFEECF